MGSWGNHLKFVGTCIIENKIKILQKLVRKYHRPFCRIVKFYFLIDIIFAQCGKKHFLYLLCTSKKQPGQKLLPILFTLGNSDLRLQSHTQGKFLVTNDSRVKNYNCGQWFQQQSRKNGFEDLIAALKAATLR